MSTFIICSSCGRHVHAREKECPFCEAKVAFSPREAPTRPALPRGLARSKLYALHAAALATGVAAAACGGTTSVVGGDAASTGVDGSGEDSGNLGNGDARVQGGDARTQGGDATTMEGMDATTTADATNPVDSGTIEDVVVDTRPCCPPYGCVFPKACGEGLKV